MKLPPDWDEPSRENKDLCDKFIYETFDYYGILPYRLFIPDSSDKVPLVLYLHGADAYGDDNELQLTMHDTKTPIWMIHAADDMVVKTSYKTDEYSANLGSRDIYEELREIHPDLHYTEYKATELKERYGINPHCSWVPAGQNDEVKEWLFSKAK